MQALAQGETAIDTFMVTVNAGIGGTRTEEVSVNVVGSNDQPLFVTNFSAAGGTYVADDVRETASGVAVANDVDHGADVTWSVTRNTSPQSPTPYSTPYSITLDELSIARNGDAFYFRDQFDDGIAPTTSAGAPAGFYYVPFGTFTESAPTGRLVLDGQLATSQRGTGFDDLMAGHLLTVGSSIKPDDATLGLRKDDNFEVTARFDLASLQPGQSYGFSLTDNTTGGIPPDQLGDDVISVEVANVGGTVVVRFVERDVVTDTLTERASSVLGHFARRHADRTAAEPRTSDPGAVRASFDLLNGSGATTSHIDLVSTEPVRIFGTDTVGYSGDDENWTRVQLIALGPDSNEDTTQVQGAFGSMTINADTGAWNYVCHQPGPARYPRQWHGVDRQLQLPRHRPVRRQRLPSGERHAGGNGSADGPGPILNFGTPNPDIMVGSQPATTASSAAPASDLLIGLAGADTFDYNILADGGRHDRGLHARRGRRSARPARPAAVARASARRVRPGGLRALVFEFRLPGAGRAPQVQVDRRRHRLAALDCRSRACTARPAPRRATT